MKKILKITGMFCLIICLCTTAQASPAGNVTAFCVGTNYGTGDINTSMDALDAAYYYTLMGLNPTFNIYPTNSALNGTSAYGNKYLASGIVFLSGHGSFECIQFNYNHNGGYYACGVKKGTTNEQPAGSGYYYWALGNFALNNVALYVFAGCETSSGSNNITSYVVSNGAKAAIGWNTVVGETSHSQWLHAFNEKLYSGYTIGAAYAYADSLSYGDIRVKSHTCYGDATHNPLDYLNPGVLMAPENEEREYLKIHAGDDMMAAMEGFLEEKEGDANWFDCRETENDFKYFDCALNYLGVHTDYVYTFCVQEDIIKVYDNTHSKNADEIREKIKDFRDKHSEDTISLQQTTEKENFLKSVDGTVESIEQYIMFSCADDCFYSVLDYVAKDPEGLHFADTLLYTIGG